MDQTSGSGHRQLLWSTVFDERFADLLRAVTRDTGRAFCSLILLRQDHCSSLKKAELLLGQRGQRAATTPHILRRLQPWTCATEFARRLTTLSDDLEGHLLPDYAQLRARFENEHSCDEAITLRLAAVIDRQTPLAPDDREILLSQHGRRTLAAWIWERAVQCRFDRSAAFNAGLRLAKARPLYQRLLDPHRRELLDELEILLDSPLHEPSLPAVPGRSEIRHT